MRRGVLLSVAVAMLAFAGAAVASSQFHSSYHFGLTSTTAGTSSGFDVSASFSDPGAPNKAPKILSGLKLSFPRGTAFDVGSHPACRGTEKTLVNKGLTKACPPDTAFGSGRADVILGTTQLGFPLHSYVIQPVGFDGNKPEIDFYVVLNPQSSNPLSFIFGPTISGSNFTTGLPDATKFGIHVTFFNLRFPAFTGKGRRPLLKTPKTCPTSGHWDGAVIASFADHTKETKTVTFRCRR